MRRLLAILMLLPLLLLAGCGKEEEQTQQALDFRTRLLDQLEIGFFVFLSVRQYQRRQDV